MTIEEILKELERYRGYFPREAVIEAAEKEAEITPKLLEILRYTIDNMKAVFDDVNFFGHMYPMYLLAQFREKRAYPLIIEFFSIPGELPLEMTGSIVTEDLSRMLLSVYNGDTDALKRLVENRNVDEFVRAAALTTLTGLAVQGMETREEIMDYFGELFNGKLERRRSHAWNMLVYLSMKMYPEEVYDDIRKAFRIFCISMIGRRMQTAIGESLTMYTAGLLGIHISRLEIRVADDGTYDVLFALSPEEQLKFDNRTISSYPIEYLYKFHKNYPKLSRRLKYQYVPEGK